MNIMSSFFPLAVTWLMLSSLVLMTSGDAGSCPEGIESCKAFNGKICNGQGNCVCGRCQCARDSFYMGPYCEECPTCPGKCTLLKPCVECSVFGTGELTDEQCVNDCENSIVIRVVDALDTSKDRLCLFYDDDGCMFRFTYQYQVNERKPKVKVGRTKMCPAGRGIAASGSDRGLVSYTLIMVVLAWTGFLH